jgi:TonB family protein
MTSGIPSDMRRTAVVSLAAHVAVLALLTVVPLAKMPPMGASSIQVMLVSKVTSPVQPPQIKPQPEPQPVAKAAPPPVAKPVERAAAVPRAAPPPVKEHPTETLQKRLKEVPVPRPVAPVQKAPLVAKAEPPKPLPAESQAKAPTSPVVKQEPVAPQGNTPEGIKEVLRRAEESLMKSPNAAAGNPAATSTTVPRRPQTSDEINKLLGQLPAPAAATSEGKRPSLRPDQPRASIADQVKSLLAQAAAPPPALERPAPKKAPAPPLEPAPQGPVEAPRSAAVERCPPKALAYCPILQAAINRAWNADTDPGVRSVLESAGDSTATIRMVILPDGVIKDIQLSKSSGNDAYDRAVQSVLRVLGHLPPLPAEMKGEPFVAVTSFTYYRKQES